MTPHGLTQHPLRLVIYDCDGVLIDSEGVASRVCAEALTELGWPMTAAESMQRFVGYSLGSMVPVIEAHIGRPLPAGWTGQLAQRLVNALSEEAQTMPGAADVLRATAALGLPFRVASNSGHAEMAAKFARTGLDSLVAGRVHSAEDVPRGKPAPDVFLHAAAAEGMPPGACIVVEDSVPGTRGAIAAGMAVIGLDPHGDGQALRAVGASHVVRALSELPPLFRTAMRHAA